VGIYVFDGTAFSSLFSFGIFKTVNYAFINMPNLASVDMSGWTGTTLSAVNGFTGCASLESFTLGSNLTFIDANAFTGSASIRFYPGSNTSFTVSDDHIMLFNADKTTLVAANGVAGSVAIPSTVTVIAANAFRDCAALTEITLPAGLTTIGQGAFVNCNIEVVTLPSSLTSLSNGAFGSSLKTVKIPGDLGLTLARTTFSGVVYELLSGGGSGGYEVFANGKLVVKDHAVLFASTELSGPLVLDPSITSITAYAFEYHKGLTSVDMSACAGLESIGNGAFYAATGLEWVKWPQSAADASVGSSAFYGATKLSRVELPDHLSSIGTSAFYSTNLTVLILRSPAVGLSSANTVSPNTLVSIYVPDAGVSAYKAATSWNNAALVNKIVGISALDDPDNADDNPANWS
jgi:hypothetical protein